MSILGAVIVPHRAERRFLRDENRSLLGGVHHGHKAHFHRDALLKIVSEDLNTSGEYMNIKVGVRLGISGTVSALPPRRKHPLLLQQYRTRRDSTHLPEGGSPSEGGPGQGEPYSGSERVRPYLQPAEGQKAERQNQQGRVERRCSQGTRVCGPVRARGTV